jgi:hypothetical protein
MSISIIDKKKIFKYLQRNQFNKINFYQAFM